MLVSLDVSVTVMVFSFLAVFMSFIFFLFAVYLAFQISVLFSVFLAFLNFGSQVQIFLSGSDVSLLNVRWFLFGYKIFCFLISVN